MHQPDSEENYMNSTLVTTRALIQRLNRILKPNGQRIRINRGRYWKHQFGAYCIWNASKNGAVEHHIDLVETGRLLGALRLGEVLEDVRPFAHPGPAL